MSYQKADERYQDSVSTAYIFIIVGVLCIVFAVCNAAGVISLFYKKYVSLGALGLIGIVCVIIGIQSFFKSRYLKDAASKEDEVEDEILSFLSENISREELEEIAGDEGDEVSYFKRMEYIKEVLGEKYKNQKEDFIDQVCDDFYNKLIK